MKGIRRNLKPHKIRKLPQIRHAKILIAINAHSWQNPAIEKRAAMVKKVTGNKPASSGAADFRNVFDALKAILTPYAGPDARVVHDKPDFFYLDTTFPVYRGKPAMFAAVRRGKAYVSYHLLPLYMNPPLNSLVSAELQRRKQGKACFNFTSVDARLFAELAELTRVGLDSFKKFAASEAAAARPAAHNSRRAAKR